MGAAQLSGRALGGTLARLPSEQSSCLSIGSPITATPKGATLLADLPIQRMTSMAVSLHICGVTVNHNTSHFVELMLRTLFLTNDLTDLRFEMTVLDNQSEDAHIDELRAYLAGQQMAFLQTGFDIGITGEKHGAAFAKFIRDHPECTHYLFLDADMWFTEPDTIPTMVAELSSASHPTFANQARIRGYYVDRVIEGRDGIAGAGAFDGQPLSTVTFWDRAYSQIWMPRCSPVCSLVANTPLFRRVVETVGLTPTYRFGVGEAFFYDTFSLMTQVMATHGQYFIVSSKTINHFTQVTYMPEHRAAKDRDCWLLLDDLRVGRGMSRENFYISDWVKQQRQQS